MGNKKRQVKAKKRQFRGNRYTVDRTLVTETPDPPIIDNVVPSPFGDNSCSSAKKIKLQAEDLNPETSETPQDGFILMDFSLLFNFLTSNMSCAECKQYSLSCKLTDTKNGFAHDITIKCTNCNAWESTLMNSKIGTESKHKEVNLRMVSFIRSVGRGHAALQDFCTHLNSPHPMTYPNYQKLFQKLHVASKAVATESMCAAAGEVRQGHQRQNASEDPVDCAVSVDGTWQRRGHASHHGVVTTISVETGKCLDAEVLTNTCKGCRHWESRKGTKEYEKWQLTHNCRVNHTGSAGAMESVGAVRIFSRSEDQRHLRYTQYLGDGDSASFKKVSESKPYPMERMLC